MQHNRKRLGSWTDKANLSHNNILALPCLTFPCRGPLAPRGAVGVRRDGLPHQLSPFLPVVCHGLNLCEGFPGPPRDVVNPAIFRTATSSHAFDCSL